MIDLFCGLGGGTEGALAEGYECIGFDLERHVYGAERYPAQLVLQDALTIHGKQFKHAAYIWASPPCQEFSYMAMPWSRAKQIAAALREILPLPNGYTGSRTTTELTALFDACFRIQREASEAAGRYIPMVVENVKGAQPWVGKAKANFGSFYLWGDVAMVGNRVVSYVPAFGQWTRPMRAQKFNPDGTEHPQGSWFKIADSKERGARKNDGGSWFNIGSPGQLETGKNPVHELAAQKVPGFNFHEYEKTGKPGRSFQSAAVGLTKDDARLVDGMKGLDGQSWVRDKTKDPRPSHGDSPARKAASAQIAKIPFALSQYIARAYKPR